jgi:acetoin utilization protein AcuB
MLVRQKMSQKPITTRTDTSVSDVLNLMHEKKVHRLPVVDVSGKLVGIVSEGDLLYASPSPATSLCMGIAFAAGEAQGGESDDPQCHYRHRGYAS